ncbi:MAG: hypothetical protein EA398_18410 [Deltaproteobacteria bacterium]|nr:MAG: hypothetical protein EA398_18410 [Deltaproteobacteria bacterium]
MVTADAIGLDVAMQARSVVAGTIAERLDAPSPETLSEWFGVEVESLSRSSEISRLVLEREEALDRLEAERRQLLRLQARVARASAERAERLPRPWFDFFVHPEGWVESLAWLSLQDVAIAVLGQLGLNDERSARATRELVALRSHEASIAEATPSVSGPSSTARERLRAESGVLDEVEQQAAEARRLAEEARRATLDAERQSLVERLDTAGNALDALLEARREEEARYESLADQEDGFDILAGEMVERINRLRMAPASDPTRAERADRIYEEAHQLRRQARRDRERVQSSLSEAREALEVARAVEAEARGQLDLLGLGQLGASPELLALRASAAEASLQVASQELRLAQLRRDRLEEQLDFSTQRIIHAARWMDDVTPWLSVQERQRRFRLGSDSVAEAVSNLQDRSVIWGDVLVNWRTHLRGVVDRVLSVDGVMGAGRLLVVLALLVLGLRQLRARRHDLIRAGLHRLERTEWAARRTTLVLKCAELLRDTTYPLASLIIAWLIFRQFPDDLSLLNLVRVTVLWLLGYHVLVTATKTLLLPRTLRSRERFRGENVEAFGIDLLSLEARTAQLLVLTVRILLLYLVVTGIFTQVVATFTGLGLVYHTVLFLVFWGRLLLLYALTWYWRDVIVEQFVRMSDLEGSRPADLLQAHKDRIYSVLVLVFLAAYVLGVEAWKLARRHLFEVNLVKRFNNFLFRKRIELAQAAQDEVGGTAVREDTTGFAGGVFHEDTFCPEEEELVRSDGVAQLVQALSDWLESTDAGGAVAVVGERNMGKSTLVGQAQRAFASHLDARSERVATTALSLPKRLLERKEVHRLLLEIFALPAHTSEDDLVDEILRLDRQIVVMDEAHNMFLRCISGFAALDYFLHVVSLTRHHVFWLLSYNLYAWRYLNRVQVRRHYFRAIVQIKPLDDAALQTLIERRCDRAGLQADFTRLSLAGANPGANAFEVVKTSAGFFRLLNEYAGGNPGVGMALWTRSLRDEGNGTFRVTLFRPPGESSLRSLDDAQLFSLAAIAQHENLTAHELAVVLNMPIGQARLHFNLFVEHSFVRVDQHGRARLHAMCQRQVLNRLRDTNLLYLKS